MRRCCSPASPPPLVLSVHTVVDRLRGLGDSGWHARYSRPLRRGASPASHGLTLMLAHSWIYGWETTSRSHGEHAKSRVPAGSLLRLRDGNVLRLQRQHGQSYMISTVGPAYAPLYCSCHCRLVRSCSDEDVPHQGVPLHVYACRDVAWGSSGLIIPTRLNRDFMPSSGEVLPVVLGWTTLRRVGRFLTLFNWCALLPRCRSSSKTLTRRPGPPDEEEALMLVRRQNSVLYGDGVQTRRLLRAAGARIERG